MTMTAQQAASIREAAEATYRELFAPADAAQLAAVGDVVAPVWRQMSREVRDQPQRRAASPTGEAA